ncbi:MAG: polysaccharide pyruvyl transferase CsaB [Fimbriimonadaceae bacterium]|nr:polysaccharide pyruvyl transferase CsaB [Fimbriimonadaceae bacterium]
MLLAGYIGCGNLGDDAIMLGYAEELRKHNVEARTTSGRPEETSQVHGVSAIPRRSMAAFKEALAEVDALVFPGGSIFQDSTSVRSVFYYANLVKLAKKAGKRVILTGQGVGPLRTGCGRSLTARAFESADYIAVRDPASKELLQQIGVKRPIAVTSDSAFLLEPPPMGEDTAGFNVGQMRTVGVAPRPLGKGIDVVGLMGEFCRMLFQSGTMPVLISMDREHDVALIQAIEDRAGGKIPDIRKVESPTDIQRRMARMDSVVAMRLHAGILAATVGVPSLMLAYDPKVTAFARSLDIGHPVSLEKLTPARLFDLYNSFAKDRSRSAAVVAQRRDEFRQSAALTVARVAELVNAGTRRS